MKPKEVVEKWIDAFNDGDADRISQLYHPDAINHQVANEHHLVNRTNKKSQLICLLSNHKLFIR